MSRAPALVGIDLGTSSVKVAVLDVDGATLATGSREYPVEHPRAQWAETDPAHWWRGVVAAVAEVVAKSDAEPVAVGFSGQMHGLVPSDAAGEPVRPAMLWSDSRAVEELAAYRRLPRTTLARLRNPLSPGMAGPMLAWLATHEPRSFVATRWALQPKDWVRARLTGEFWSEPSDASATLLYDVVADAWDPQIVRGLGLDPQVLAPILPAAGQCAGMLLPEAADDLGLAAGIPVAAGAGDTAAAALGSGLVAPGDVQLTIGTGATIVTPVAQPPPGAGDAEPVTHLYRAATDAGWYSMAAVLNAGSVLGWVRAVLGVSWPHLYAAAASPAESDDPMFLPHLTGERTPYLDPAMRGAWVGLSPRHDRTALLRAALEGVALSIREALTALRDAGAAAPDLRLAGGGSTDSAWRQLLSDVLGTSLLPVQVPAASACGAALLGARAAELLDEPSLLSLLAGAEPAAAVPRAGPAAYYTERHALFRRRVDALRSHEEEDS